MKKIKHTNFINGFVQDYLSAIPICKLLINVIIMLSVFNVTAFAAEKPQAVHYIPWAFVAYAEPDFMSEQKGSFGAQTVTVLETNDSGWALIDSYDGQWWVYIHSNSRYIDRRMELFDNKEDEIPITTIGPQIVSITEQDGSWLQVSTWLGPKWIDLKFSPSSDKLERFMKRYNNTVSVYYENLETGYVYRYNADKVYFTASVIKAPYCLYVYHLAENGQADLSAEHIYTSKDYYGGSGIIKDMKVGTVFTENELLEHTIRKSDNIATKMLIDRYGVSGFKEFVSEIGGNPGRINNILYNNPVALMTANEAGFYTKAIYDYIEGGYTYSEQLKTDLMNTTTPMIVSDFPIARKYGWAKKSFHDTGIIYSSSPYILVIMSARDGGTAADFAAFRDISTEIQDFNEQWFAHDKHGNE